MTKLGMNKMISCTGKIVPLTVLVGISFIFWLLKQLGCSINECCMIIATVAMAFFTYRGNQQNKVGIEASQKQAEATTEQTKAIQQQIEISKQQAEAANQQADIARKELEEAQKQREEMYRPKLEVYFEMKNRYSLKLLVKNVGKSPAYHIKVKCEAPWLKRRFKPDSWEYLNSDGAPFYTELRPGQEISLQCLNRLNFRGIAKTGSNAFVIVDNTGKNYDNFLAVSETEQYLMEAQPLNITIGYDKNNKNSDEKKDYEEPFIVNPSEATFRHFQFDPEDTKIFSPLFVPTEADYEKMMRFIDDVVALHLGETYETIISKTTKNNPKLEYFARDINNIMPDILQGQYKDCFENSSCDLYKRFIEAVKEIWMTIVKIEHFILLNRYHLGTHETKFLDKHFPDCNSEGRKKELEALDKEWEMVIDKIKNNNLNADDILNLKYFRELQETFFDIEPHEIPKLAKEFPKNIKEDPDFLEIKIISIEGSDLYKNKQTLELVEPKMEEITEKTHINGCEVSVNSNRESYHNIENILNETEEHLWKKDNIYNRQLILFIDKLQYLSTPPSPLFLDDYDYEALWEAEVAYVHVKVAFKYELDAQKRQTLKRKFQSTLFKFALCLSTSENKYADIKREFDEILEAFRQDTAAHGSSFDV